MCQLQHTKGSIAYVPVPVYVHVPVPAPAPAPVHVRVHVYVHHSTCCNDHPQVAAAEQDLDNLAVLCGQAAVVVDPDAPQQGPLEGVSSLHAIGGLLYQLAQLLRGQGPRPSRKAEV